MASRGRDPRYPIYIVSKGRWESRKTAKALEAMATPYRIVVEPQEADAYRAVIDPTKVLVLPFSNLGQGSIPARNWAWEHSISEGHARHWCVDDNIEYFLRFHDNRRWVLRSSIGFCLMEDFVDRYENVAIAGPQYEKFAKIKEFFDRPFATNTRVYSCNLIDNNLPFRWRGRYNEDTDLCLRALKGGSVTILFYAWLAQKAGTMTMKGGNTDELYRRDEEFDGRLEMAQSLKAQHPDVTHIVRRFNRWHHHVDYRMFVGNALRRRGDLLPEGDDEHGIEMIVPPKKGMAKLLDDFWLGYEPDV